MARNMSSGTSVGRPAQGKAPTKQIGFTGGKQDPAPRVRGRGSVSKPSALPKWSPQLSGDAANQTPRVVSK